MEKKKLNYQHLLFSIGIFLFLVLTTISCSRDENDSAEYYVKYEVNSTTIYSGGTLNVSVNDVNDKKTNFVINTRTPWEIIVGPVQKGFISSVSVSEITGNYGRLTIQTKISVSKNNGPFAIKNNDDSTTPRTQVQTNYKIDF